MAQITDISLAQIVNIDHRAASVFEKYHLDFCCNGKRTLAQACKEKNIDIDPIVQELNSTMSSTCSMKFNFDAMTLTQLSDYIVLTHHEYVKKEMPQMYLYLHRVASKHGQRHPEMIEVFNIFELLKDEMEQHMEKEELVLFPRIKMIENHTNGFDPMQGNRFSTAYLESPVMTMEEEHDHAGEIMDKIRNLTNNYTLPADACTTYKLCFASLQAFEADLHQHVHLENNILFPKAIVLLKKNAESAMN